MRLVGGGGPEQRPQVLEVERARAEIAGQVGPAVVRRVDLHRAFQVGRTDAAIDTVDMVDHVVAADLGRDRITRRIGQGQAGQVIEVGQVVAAQRHGGVHLAQVERVQYAALGGDARVAGGDGQVERIGHGRLDVQQRPAGGVHLEHLGVQAAVAGHAEGRIARIRLFVSEDGAGEGQLALHAGHPEMTVIDDEVLDQRQFQRLAGLGAVAEVPVGLARLVLEQDDVGARDFQPRQDDMAVQRRQRLGLDVDLVDEGQVVLRCADDAGRRLANVQAAQCRVGREAEQVDAQVAVDGGRTVGLVGDDRAQGGTRPVPVGIGQEDDDGDQDQDDDDDGGDDPAHRPGHLGPMVTRALPAVAPGVGQGLFGLRFGRGHGVGLRRGLGRSGAPGGLAPRWRVEGLVVAAHGGA